jgi:sugar lactone lactonase YvrE
LIAAAIVFVRIAPGHLEGLRPTATSANATAEASDQAAEEAALKAAEPIDPATIGYHETGTFPAGFREARALAVDPDGQIYVAGDRAVERYSNDGKNRGGFALEGDPRCLAIGALDPAKAVQLYVGMDDHIEVYDPQGTRIAVWPAPRAGAIFTSLATTENQVWVADAGNRLVWRFSAAGKLLEPVGQPDASHNQPGFLVTDPDHHFDLAAGTDDLVYVVNPRLLRVESFTHNGDYETHWGQGSPAVADFFGCCNPAQLAVLPDGRFVTAEKGLPRVKIYSHDGRFQTVVAGPSQLTDTPADLAADRHGRVLVLDRRAAKVRVFETNSSNQGDRQ